MADSPGRWHRFKTKLLIGADGANSFVREQAFIDLDVLDYKQAGLSCAIQTAQPNQHVGPSDFSGNWPIGLFTDGQFKAGDRKAIGNRFVWTLPDDMQKNMPAFNDAEFYCIAHA